MKRQAKPEYLRRFKYPGNPIFTGTGRPGDFDSVYADAPRVFTHDDVAYLFYTGYDGERTRGGIAESRDLIHWENRRLVLDAGPEGAWDGGAANPLYVYQEEDGTFVMTYCAFGAAGIEQGPGSIGVAYSKDLVHWEREVANPILSPCEEDAWETGGLYSSNVVKHEGQYYLFYNAKNIGDPTLSSYEGDDWTWTEQIGLATGPDLLHLERHPNNPVLRVGPPGSLDHRYVSDPWVIWIEGRWHMFYFGASRDDSFSVPCVYEDCLAVSDDLVNWTKSPYNPIIRRGPDVYDQRGAHKPSVVLFRGIYYHVYVGVNQTAAGPDRVICLATSHPIDQK